jgi:hypothetical protein
MMEGVMADNNDMDVYQLTQDNILLFKLLFCHQVFLEGVRYNYSARFQKLLIALYKEFQRFIGQIKYTTLDDWTKAEMNEFIYRLKLAQQGLFSYYTAELISILQQFVGTDVDVTRAIYSSVLGSSPEAANDQREHDMLKGIGMAAGTVEGNAALWASISNDPIPANGLTIPQMVQQFVAAAQNQVTRRVRMGYANGWTPQELLANIAGNQKRNWQGSYFAQLNAQAASMIGTALQHASIVAQGVIASAYLSSYTWVSVMDSHTTLICWERNGKTYLYGKGPLPPANYNCRSKTVGIIPGADPVEFPTTFSGALSELDARMLETLLTPGQRATLRKGGVIDLADVATSLTLAQFKALNKTILGA